MSTASLTGKGAVLGGDTFETWASDAVGDNGREILAKASLASDGSSLFGDE